MKTFTARSKTRILCCFAGAFLSLLAFARAQEAKIEIDASQTLHRVPPWLTGACIEDVNHEVYGGIDSQMIYGESFQEPGTASTRGVSGEWRPIISGHARASFDLTRRRPFAGAQSQRLSFVSGEGAVGIENQGLHHWGMNLVAGKPYEGRIWARAGRPTECFAALESSDGKTVYAESHFTVASRDWQRLDFVLIPDAGDSHGRLSLKLKQPGAITIGYAFLQPGDWGRFKGLPDRRDVVEGLVNQGVTVLRHGGSMVNAPEYRWKKMTGPRDFRPPFHGTWSPHSSNGWGILDFLNLCEAAGFLGIPAFNMDETARDMADFVEYANGPADSAWGARRVLDGHPAPYNLTHIELGNEERVDGAYWRKFKALAEAIWAKDSKMILVVGDFGYEGRMVDPFHFTGANSDITTLAAHQKILRLAKAHDREVWFDVHVWTAGPRPTDSLEGALSYRDALEKIADGARFRLAVFELNADNHDQRRALANALAIQTFEHDGRVPVVTSANCLQPDGQNDNGWDQGLLFLNPSQVWLQPPGYVTRMISRHYQPFLVKSGAQSPGDILNVSAQRSEDGKTLVLQVVNLADKPTLAVIHMAGFTPANPAAAVEELAAPLDAANTAQAPERVIPVEKEWRHDIANGDANFTFQPHSFTLIQFN